jgi:thymidine phosphorylase
VEVREALDYLQNKNVNPRLDIVTKTLCAKLLCQCNHFNKTEEAQKAVSVALSSGKALEKFAKMASTLGAPTDFVERSNAYLPRATHQKPIFAPQEGYVVSMDTRAIGLSIIELGGGRKVPTQKLDLATGYTEFAQIGDKVDDKTPLAMVHYQTEEQYQKAKEQILNAIRIENTKPDIKDPILLTI